MKEGAAPPEVVELPGYVAQSSPLYQNQINALKTPTPVINVPQSLTITDSEAIRLRGFDQIGDIVEYTPGVNMSQGEGHRDAVVFRGVRSTAAFFVDGQRDDVQYYRPLYNVEQVEILRGPNALLFGRGGAGGILNRVTKKGRIGEDFNAYSLRLDTFGAGEVQVDSNVGLNENAAFRINAYFESIENHRDFSEGERYGVNPTFKFQLTDDTTLDVSYEYLDHERFVDRGIPTGADDEPVEAFDDIFFGDPELNESAFEAHVFRALLQHTFSDSWKANLNATYGDYDKVYQNLFVSDFDETATPDRVELDGYVDRTDRQNTVLTGNLVGEFETGDIRHTLLLGAEYIDTSSDQDRFNARWSPMGTETEEFSVNRPITLNGGTGVNADGMPTSVDFTTDLNDDTSTELDVYSLYVQDEVELTDQLRVVLGARFDAFDITVDDNEPGGTGGSQKDEEISPRGGIIYKPGENISLYVSYSESFLPQSGEQFADLGDEGLDPDEFTNLEAGVKWDFNPGLSFTAAVFQNEQDIVRDDGAGGSESLETMIEGFETQIKGRITDRWRISAGYSYLDGELDNGNTPREIPENMISVWNHYQLTNKLGLGLGAIYQDSSFMTNNEAAELPAFIRVDAAAYYRISENLRFQVNVENLLDEDYFPSSHSTHQATVGAPIHARFAISGRF